MRLARIVVGLFFAFVLLIVTGLGALYAAQPTSYRITRTHVLSAPLPRVMAQLVDVRAFQTWQPWPALPGETPTLTYSPATSGVGAWMDRREPHGGARTTITSIGSDSVEMDNVTSGSFGGGTSHQSFALRATANGTEVTWTLSSDLHGLARMLWPFVHIEASVGTSMEDGFTRLDRAAQP